MAATNQNYLDALKKGDREAFTQTYNTFFPRLFVVALNVLHIKEDAEEAASDALLDLDRHKEKIQDEQHLEKFLVTVTRHKAIDRIRRQSSKVHTTPVIPEQIDPFHDQLLAKLVELELKKLVRTKMETLPEKYKLVLRYYFLDQMAVRNIAVEMHVTEKRVYKYLDKAKILLRNTMNDNDWKDFLGIILLLMLKKILTDGGKIS